MLSSLVSDWSSDVCSSDLYPSVWGLEESRKEAERLTGVALDALKIFGDRGGRLREIAEWMLVREY
jgi:geranylgeranyl diphosphate synthase type II